MNTARKAIVGGAFGALATATVAASAAFACHPISYLELSHAQGPPGMTMRVEGNGFDPGIDLEIRWADGATTTEVLGITEVKAVDLTTGRAQAIATVRIPVNAAVRAEPYTMVGTQTAANGKVLRAVKPFTVVAPPAPGPVKDDTVATPNEAVTPVTPGSEAGPPVLAATPAEQTPASPVAATPAANSSTAGPVAAARPAATSAAPTGRTDAVASPAPATAGAPAAPRTSDAAAAAPAPSAASPAAARTAAPGPDDLWSAVGADRQPSLLDAPASAPQSGGAPVGGILTGAGVLALAGAALLVGRRRLALARTR